MEKNEPPTNERLPVMFIPGGISPAAVTYGPLLEALKDEVRPLLKDLEVYAADEGAAGEDVCIDRCDSTTLLVSHGVQGQRPCRSARCPRNPLFSYVLCRHRRHKT
jgi:hypothetical protein